MKTFSIALVSCPVWDVEFPPYNIALLAAVLKSAGLHADCFDLNRTLYISCHQEACAWQLSDLYAFWQSQDKIRNFIFSNYKFINEFINKLETYDIIGFSVQSLNFVFTIELAKLIKKQFPQKTIVAGGPECFQNFNPEYLMGFNCFDGICCGEGEEALPELIDKIQNNEQWETPGFLLKIQNNHCNCGARKLIEDLDSLPFADFSFVGRKTEKLCISTSRGCISRCTFCHEKSHWEKFRMRSVSSVVEELSILKKEFPQLHFVYLNDSLINGNMREFEKFCNLMVTKNLGIKWGGHILVRKEMDSAFLKRMKRAGAERLNYGVESGSNAVLAMMNKTFNRELALRVLKNTKEADISFSVNLIVGHPGETETELEETAALLRQIRQLTNCVHINPCLVLKHSDLYTNHKRWGIILPDNYVTDWYLKDGSNTVSIRTERMRALRN